MYKIFQNLNVVILKKLLNSRYVSTPLLSKRSNYVKQISTYSLIRRVYQNEIKEKNRIFKGFVVFCSSYLVYTLVKQKLSILPVVNALTLNTTTPLSGRKHYNFIAEVVEKSAPAVVYIEIKDSRRVDFFTGRPLTLSNGSGFIIDSNGLIVTNAHVVTNKPSAKVEVKLIDGRSFYGVVEHIDIQSDLATIRIPATNLPTIKLGNSADLKPGEFVVAIGSPLALSNTVTSGVISSVQRGSEELGLHGKDMVYIQTDAAITFGNSGGPLVNLDGEAIGVNSMKVTSGISFAIPIDYVKQFLKKAADNPKKASEGPKKLYMGITMLTLTPQILNELKQRHDLKLSSDLKGGVLVWKIILGSPAYKGGLQLGDIITHIDGKLIINANDVYEILKNSNASELKLSVSRHGLDVNVIVYPEILS